MDYDDEFDDYEEEMKSDRQRRFQLYFLIVLVVFGIGLGVLWNRIVITVQSGEAGVLYRWV